MRVVVLSGVARRRWWSDDEKPRIIEETLVPGARVAEVARCHAVSASLPAWLSNYTRNPSGGVTRNPSTPAILRRRFEPMRVSL